MSCASMEARLVNAQHRNFSLDTWKEKKRSLKKYLIHTAVRWKLFQAQWNTIGKCSTSSSLTHIVKGGETLTSISRQYGVSILEIAAENGKIVDIDFLLEGERLNIPVHPEKLQMYSDKVYDRTLHRWKSVSNIQWTHETRKVLSNLSSYHSQIALQGRAIKKTKRQEPNKLRAPPCGLRTDRWRTILDDHTESDTIDAPSGEDLGDPFEEDHSTTRSEETSDEYNKLESAYLKFLSECGMSKWGYFRGGLPE